MDLSVRSIPLLATVIVCWYGCAGKAEKQAPAAPVKVTLSEVQPVNRVHQLTYSGTIEPDNTAQIGFAVPGVVNQVAVQEGQMVTQGQLLATIDATEYLNALAIAEAGLEQAEDMYNRLNELYNKGSLPAKDYIDIKTKLAQAKANKNLNAKRIADSKLYAPITGIITAKLIEKGSTAAPGVPAFTIVKTDKVYAKIAVPESEVGSLKKGMEAGVYIPTMGDSLSGKITIINPQAEAISKTYTVKIQLTNTKQQLLPGMIANVYMQPGRKENVLVIPATAVVRDADDMTYVYIVDAQHKALRRRIYTGNITGTQEIVVTNGLTAGDKVVMAGHTKLKDGASVTF